MNIIVHGCTGRMGTIVTEMLESGFNGHSLAAGVSPECPSGLVPRRCVRLDEFDGSADCVIDFSHHSAAAELTGYCVRRSLPLVIATTGQTEAELSMIRARVRSGMANAKAKGKQIGRPPPRIYRLSSSAITPPLPLEV